MRYCFAFALTLPWAIVNTDSYLPPMLLLEAFFKFTILGVFMAQVVLIIKSKERSNTITLALFLLASFSCVLVSTGHEQLRVTGVLAIPLSLFNAISPACVWLLGLSLFDDGFRLRRSHWLVVIIYVAVMLPIRFHYLSFDLTWLNTEITNITPLSSVASAILLAMMLHLTWVALKGRDEDLLESRRKARVGFSIALVTIICSIMVVERVSVFIGWDSGFDVALYMNYVLVLPVALWSVHWLANFDPEALRFQRREPEKATKAPLDAKEQLAYKRLIDFIETKQGYLEHGLTISTLAQKLEIPAHQLRPLINKQLGYSNFSSFLNHYRIKQVKARLSDLELARTPILTIALEAGFSTLSTFNRAFKMEVGITPTEFRSQKMDIPINKAD